MRQEMHLSGGNIAIFVEGKKSKIKNKLNQHRLFREAGLKLLLFLLSNPDSLNIPYRELAKKTGVALGSVSNVFKELETNNYLLKTKDKRVLKNRSEIIERWVVAYNEILKPRSFRKKMTTKAEKLHVNRILEHSDLKLYFGGEPGGQILTHYLVPKDFTIYTNEEMSKVAKKLNFIPNESGNVEIYSIFWSDDLVLENKKAAPPLVVYADLMGTGNNRNIETAKMILENGL